MFSFYPARVFMGNKTMFLYNQKIFWSCCFWKKIIVSFWDGNFKFFKNHDFKLFHRSIQKFYVTLHTSTFSDFISPRFQTFHLCIFWHYSFTPKKIYMNKLKNIKKIFFYIIIILLNYNLNIILKICMYIYTKSSKFRVIHVKHQL